MTRPTTAEIAKMAGVSPSAVSFALNGKRGISEKTRARVLDVARQLGYFRLSSRFALGNTANVAVLFPNYIPIQDHLFYTELNASIMQACQDQPVNLIMASVFSRGNELVVSENLRSDIVNGVLVYGDVESGVLTQLQNLNVPIVALDSSRRDSVFPSVQVDYESAAYDITRYLIDLGHRDIALIGNDKLRDFNLSVFEGFQRATMERNILLKTNRIQLNVYDADSHIVCIDEIFSDPEPPTAIVCATDFYAMRTMRRLHHKGLRVPDDISVVGIDDLITSRHLVPSLTTMSVDCQRMGQLGIEMLQRAVFGEPCESVLMPRCELVQRESAAPYVAPQR